MQAKAVYLALCVPGAVLPYWMFVPWVAEHGLNLRVMMTELFATRIGAFFGMDVIVSAVVVAAFMKTERGRGIAVGWLPVVALLTVGVSLALPLYLYLREGARERAGSATMP